MVYQYKREPLSIEEADRLRGAAHSVDEKLCVWGLLETGLRVSELAGLRAGHASTRQSSSVPSSCDSRNMNTNRFDTG